MSKVAIVTDSNSGITQKQGEELGITVLSMPFMIDIETYFEDITLTRAEFYEKLQGNAVISTSQPSPETILKLWNKLLETYDEVVHIPMSSGLSSSCATASMMAEEFEGNVQVVDNQRISVTQRQSVFDAIALTEQGKSAKEIKQILEADKLNASIYIMVDTLSYLKRGGRITPAAAALGTVLKIKPVLQIQGEKLDAFAKARTVNQAKSIMTTAIKNDINNRFGGVDVQNVYIEVVHSENEEAAVAFREELKEMFPGYDIGIHHLSLSVACHIGPGALAIACSQKLSI